MFLVRDIMYCKPGKARQMVDKFRALSAQMQTLGVGSMRVMTDLTAERYWTVVAETQVDNMDRYTEMSRKSMEIKEVQEVMKGYHDLIDHGRREIYVIES